MMLFWFLSLTVTTLLGCTDDNNPFTGDCVDNTDFVASETFRYVIPPASHSKLVLEGVNGEVNISGAADADSIRITGERRVGSESMEDAEEHLQELEVTVSDMGTELHVETIQPGDTDCRSYIVDYEIVLPESINVDATNVNGIIEVSRLRGALDASTTNGQITIDETWGNVEASLTNGKIEALLTVPHDGEVSLTTVNGGIELSIPDTTSADFSAEIVQGTIEIGGGLVLDDAVYTDSSVTGTLGDGEGTITLRTVNGNIIASGF
jgi:DUF4097 and DUF4098 domain-containing protein YvlB